MCHTDTNIAIDVAYDSLSSALCLECSRCNASTLNDIKVWDNSIGID
jgi:hypothetical protein